MSEATSWRELLNSIISNVNERRRIASEIGVHTTTLKRWVNRTSSPHIQLLRLLPSALPRHQQNLFIQLLEDEGIDLLEEKPRDPMDQIECMFAWQVLELRTSTTENLLAWALEHKVFQHALVALDPRRLGLAIRIIVCMPPGPDGKIRSLRESVGSGTAPWPANLEEFDAVFLGAESLAGYAVSLCRQETIQDLRTTMSLSPFCRGDYELSATAVPILFANRIAGCVLISSTQPDYFTSPALLEKIRNYTNLIALAFREEQFYSLDALELRLMPPLKVQSIYLSAARQRVVALMKDSLIGSQALTRLEAENIVWKQLEQEMIAVS